MKMALDLAARGQGKTSPNPVVGAVVVKAGIVVGSGYHQAAGGPHAEVHALDAAGDSARGATLYVTLEPCNHHGRTPPCTERILAAGIREVVVGMKDPNPDVCGGGIDRLEKGGVVVRSGICENEARRQNEIFIKYVGTKRPFVMAKCAATLDGQIAAGSGDSRWVSGPESRAYVHRLRHRVDAILVGVETVRKDDPRLTTRLADQAGRDPIRVILDTHLSIPETAALLHQKSEAETLVITGAAVSAAKKGRIEKSGARVIRASRKAGRIDLEALMDRLGAMEITSVLIEGGSRVLGSAFTSKIVDRIFFFYAPRILGGNEGFPICRGPVPPLMNQSIPIRDIDIRRFGDDILVSGYVAKG